MSVVARNHIFFGREAGIIFLADSASVLVELEDGRDPLRLIRIFLADSASFLVELEDGRDPLRLTLRRRDEEDPLRLIRPTDEEDPCLLLPRRRDDEESLRLIRPTDEEDPVWLIPCGEFLKMCFFAVRDASTCLAIASMLEL